MVPFLLLLLLLLLLLAGADDTSTPAIIRTICGRNRTQNPQDFDVNFVDAMEKVSRQITASSFGAAVSGAPPHTVYGLGQCYGYLSPVDCQLCYAESRVKLPLCLPATTGRIYLDGCFLRYADYDESGESADESDTRVCGNHSSSSSNASEFAQVVVRLVKNLTAAAAAAGEKGYYYYNNSGVVVGPQGMSVYGMAQCWRSLNRSSCQLCLENAGESVVGCLPATDGKALNAGCFLRYSTEPFYLLAPAPASGGGGGSSVRRQLGVALGCVFASIIVIGVAILWRRSHSTGSTDDMDSSSEIIRSISESGIGFRYEDLRKATDDFNQVNKLGQGGYGSVYKGILPDGKEIAVKRLFVNTRQWIDQFFNEVNFISQIQHKNLVKLLGCSVEGPESLLVYEYLCNTSLDHFLFDSFKKNSLDWERRFNIVVGTAEGIAYLHDASELRIIHRDIKASNILLDDKFRPKISDFGLARYFGEDQSHLSTGLAGTFGYMAPEYVVHGQLTEKVDIYSYGIVVLEIVTGRKNQNSIAEGDSLMSQIWKHYNSRTLIEILDPYIQGQCSDEQALRVFHVGLLCTQQSPGLRPPMWKVVEMLTSKSTDLPLPTQPPFINIKGADINTGASQSSNLFSSNSKSPMSNNQMSVSILRGR